MSLHHLMPPQSRKSSNTGTTHFSTPLGEIQPPIPSNYPISSSGRDTRLIPPSKGVHHSHASFQDQNLAMDAPRPGLGAIGDQRKASAGRAGSSSNTSSDRDAAVSESSNTGPLLRSLAMTPDLDANYARVHQQQSLHNPNYFPQDQNQDRASSTATFPPSQSQHNAHQMQMHQLLASFAQCQPFAIEAPIALPLAQNSSSPELSDHPHLEATAEPHSSREPSPRSSFLNQFSSSVRTSRDEYAHLGRGFPPPSATRDYFEAGAHGSFPDSRRSSLGHQMVPGLGLSREDGMPIVGRSMDRTRISSDPRVLELQVQIERLQIEQARLQQLQLLRLAPQQQSQVQQAGPFVSSRPLILPQQQSFASVSSRPLSPRSRAPSLSNDTHQIQPLQHHQGRITQQQQQQQHSGFENNMHNSSAGNNVPSRTMLGLALSRKPSASSVVDRMYSSLAAMDPQLTSSLPAASAHPNGNNNTEAQQMTSPSVPSFHPAASTSSVSARASGSSPLNSSSGGSDPRAPENINFRDLLQPTSEPPYHQLAYRITRHGDQQASIFIQQKLKACSTSSPQDIIERERILDAILANAFEMMTNRFGNWAFQRCLEEPCSIEDKRRVAGAMKGRVVELATNCYGTHVVQKALECEEDIRLFVLEELLLGDPALTLINKHASHVWSRIMELTWSAPAPPIFTFVNKALKGRWVELATHETGSLVVQHMFENCVEEDTRDCLEEVFSGFTAVVRDQWGAFVIEHLLEHGLPEHRTRAISLLGANLGLYATITQAMKSIDKALKSCNEEAMEVFTTSLCDPGKTGRRPLIVDLALNANGSQLVAQLLPMANTDQRKRLAAAIKKHVVTLKGNKAGSKIVWMFDRMRAYDGN
ncbi:hypothetical protein FRB94_009367 [Tulasnella sp. JGI-2019a]|nr:hypothetical protein FRB93_008754 [Tulasnella sp. JGI-2019a]KAG8995150.1 hypothetical protein FRB94_009367 [Tulasnella sp. JGI-2019a]KAG9026229.1 hypothetical protein FRB95_009067 [Tulasnella sp. JGI-2019a]